MSNNRSQEETIAALQEQMAMYAQLAGSIGTKANADYKAVQAALDSDNVLAAQVALIALQRATEPVSPGPPGQNLLDAIA